MLVWSTRKCVKLQVLPVVASQPDPERANLDRLARRVAAQAHVPVEIASRHLEANMVVRP